MTGRKKATGKNKARPTTKHPGGGPSKYSLVLIKKIAALISDGIPMAHICREPGMPGVTTVWDWQKRHTDASELIARAREDGYDKIAADCMRIADSPVTGEESEFDSEGKLTKRKTGDMLGHRKLQIDTRLKLLAKWDPKRYGERLGVDHDVVGNLSEVLKDRRERARKERDEAE